MQYLGQNEKVIKRKSGDLGVCVPGSLKGWRKPVKLVASFWIVNIHLFRPFAKGENYTKGPPFINNFSILIEK